MGFRVSATQKIVIPYLIASAVSLGALTLWYSGEQHTEGQRELLVQTGSLARALASAAGSSIASRDYTELAALLREQVGLCSDVVYGEVRERSGRVLASTMVPSSASQDAREVRRVSGDVRQRIPGRAGADFELQVPIRLFDRQAGTLVLGVSEDRLARRRKRFLASVLTIGAIVSALGVVLFSGVVRRAVLLPLSRLTEAAERIGQGAYRTRVELATGDELELLARTFNTMSERLCRSLEELEAAKIYAEKIVGTLNEMLFVVDEGGVVLQVNPAATRLLERREEELLGLELTEIMACDEPAEQTIARVLEQGRISDMKCRFVTASGEWIPVLVAAACMPAGAADAVRIVVSAADLRETERFLAAAARAEAEKARADELARANEEIERSKTALEAAESYSRAIVETAPNGIIAIRADGTIDRINDAAERMFGYERGELIGQSINVLMTELDAARHDELVARRVRVSEEERRRGERRPWIRPPREQRAKRKDGTIFPVDIALAEVRLPDRLLFTGIVRDLTEKKQHEAQLEALHRKLREASRRAGMAQIASGVLHNLGNTLNSVNVCAERIEEILRTSKLSSLARLTKLLEEHAEGFERFVREDRRGKLLPSYLAALEEQLQLERENVCEEARALLDHVHELKRRVAEHQSHLAPGLVAEAVPPRELCRNALGRLTEAIEAHDIDVIESIELERPLWVDAHLTKQVLAALIENAIEALSASERRPRELRIHVGRAREGWVQFMIEDNGVGFRPEDRVKLFRRGFTTKQAAAGNGLHESANLASAMGGRLDGMSEGPGRGATFVLELPERAAQPERQVA